MKLKNSTSVCKDLACVLHIKVECLSTCYGQLIYITLSFVTFKPRPYSQSFWLTFAENCWSDNMVFVFLFVGEEKHAKVDAEEITMPNRTGSWSSFFHLAVKEIKIKSRGTWGLPIWACKPESIHTDCHDSSLPEGRMNVCHSQHWYTPRAHMNT